MTTYASARGKGWIDVQCDNCRTRYSCLVEGVGTASNQLLPFSDESLKDFAQADLNAELTVKAARIPCPECGAYSDALVGETQEKARRRTFWAVFAGGGFLLLIVVVGLLNAIVHRAESKGAPSWFFLVIVGTFVTAFIAARRGSQMAYESADLNRDLARNKKSSQRKLAAGQIKILSEPGKK